VGRHSSINPHSGYTFFAHVIPNLFTVAFVLTSKVALANASASFLGFLKMTEKLSMVLYVFVFRKLNKSK
jgi:hypothetical protein